MRINWTRVLSILDADAKSQQVQAVKDVPHRSDPRTLAVRRVQAVRGDQ